MSGHSKWAQIKRSKAVKDAQKGAVFARLSREIMVASRLGGPDPSGNFRLRTAIEKAKTAALPSDNIQRAIDKGCGKGGADTMETLTYEGYGPGGAAILIQAMTDNRNRTAGDIRSYFNKYQGNLGADGCVAWLFHERGEIRLPSILTLDEDQLMTLALDLGVADVTTDSNDEGEDRWLLTTAPDDLNPVCQALTQAGLTIVSAEVSRQPETWLTVAELTVAKPLIRLLDALEDHDDVQHVDTNAIIEDQLLSQVLSS